MLDSVAREEFDDEPLPTLDAEMREELQAIREGRFIGKSYATTDEMFREILGDDWRERNVVNRGNVHSV